LGANGVWSQVMSNKSVPILSKFQVFNSVFRSIVCFGAEVWGFKSYPILTKFFAFFVKKLFTLPTATPTYMLILEMGMEALDVHCLRLHIRYIIKCLSLEGNRLPYIAAKEVIRRKAFWFKEWICLFEKFQLGPLEALEDINLWKPLLESLVQCVANHHFEAAHDRAIKSRHFDLYKTLLTENCQFRASTLFSQLNVQEMAWLLKMRGDLLYLNCRPWMEGDSESQICSLCNSNSKEDLFHFLAVCPMLVEVRVPILGKKLLSREEIKAYVCGSVPCTPLIHYVSRAWKTRWEWLADSR